MNIALPATQSREQILDGLVARFAERAAAHDRSGTISFANLDDLRAAGFLSLAVPQDRGGAGIGLAEITHIVARLAEGDPSTALILAMQYLQGGAFAASTYWPEPVRDQLFGSILQDGALLNALRVEPELGTPARGGLPATTVRRDGDRFLLSGRKIFSTGSTALRWGMVWARTDEAAPRVGQVLVPLDLPGIRIEESWNQMGMRATASHTFIFEDVEIPERCLAGLRPPGSVDEAVALASWHAIVIAALYDGIARAARNWLIGYLHGRVPANLGASLATLPRFHVLLGEIDALLLTNRALIAHGLERAGQSGDASGNMGSADAGLIKYTVTENAIDAVGKAVAAIGNPGLSQDNPLERHYRNVLCGRIHTPQGDSALGSAGRIALEVGVASGA